MSELVPSYLAMALAGRYDLADLLGRGGMATVYRARDVKHQRDVAIKVLRPEVAHSVGAERFLKEIEIVAKLTHPHILPLHDSGEAAGFVYYVMPLIEGGSLRQTLHRERRLPVSRALEIATPVANALGYAHRMGVLHRDIKPENILFSQGHPVVADFGIARAVRSATDESFTRTGLALGTPGYMSPEQAAGMRELSERTDVYGLAAVVYEMVVGEVPAGWPSEESLAMERMTDVPASHRARLTEAGERVEAALVRGLALRHDDRTPTPDALIDDLRGRAAPPVRRRYRRDEVDAIVKRASEMEASKPTSAMTIGGVEAIAAEVGIAPDLVREAARSLEPAALRSRSPAAARSEPPSVPASQLMRRNVLIGGPTRLAYEGVVEGEVPESEFAVLVDEIRRAVGGVGLANSFGRSMTWTLNKPGSTRDVEVSVTVRNGRTLIRAHENLNGLIGATFGGIGGGVGGGGLGPLSALLAGVAHVPGRLFMFIIPVWFVTVYFGARAAYAHFVRRRQDVLEELTERLTVMSRELIEDAELKREPVAT